MCGIVGYCGKGNAAAALLQGLEKLEYRGYDSAGIAVGSPGGAVSVVKATGKLINLREKIGRTNLPESGCGIGHTRWATHGGPDEKNAHPHGSGPESPEMTSSGCANVIGVHNGIIENFRELKSKLARHGYTFYSETDTEVVIKLVDYYYRKYGFGPIDAINRMMVRTRGSYALAFMFRDYPGEIYAARKDSPMIIGCAEGETCIASDQAAFGSPMEKVWYIGNMQAARILPGEVHFYDLNGDEIALEAAKVTWDPKAADKGGYRHYMLKEIHEQPAAARAVLGSLIGEKGVDLSAAGLTNGILRGISDVRIVACGSAWHVGMAAQYIMEDLAEVQTRAELASEFRYRKQLLPGQPLVIVISQSGETADSIEALRIAKEKGVRTLGIVNVEGSTIAREADHVIYTLAGPEIAVATTKAFSAQLLVVYVLAVQLALVRGRISHQQYEAYLRELAQIPHKIERVLAEEPEIQRIAANFANVSDVFFIGRGADYAAGLEGSLKMKEISYIHSEAYAAGELKHGTISLIEEGTPVIGVLTQRGLFEKTVSNLEECRARGACLTGVGTEETLSRANLTYRICIPASDDHFAPLLAVIPLQLLGYYISASRGLDVDKPRNLAKSVTVE